MHFHLFPPPTNPVIYFRSFGLFTPFLTSFLISKVLWFPAVWRTMCFLTRHKDSLQYDSNLLSDFLLFLFTNCSLLRLVLGPVVYSVHRMPFLSNDHICLVTLKTFVPLARCAFLSCLYQILERWLWEKYLISLNLNFLICKKGLKIAPL